jgi:hypothetical protein
MSLHYYKYFYLYRHKSVRLIDAFGVPFFYFYRKSYPLGGHSRLNRESYLFCLA